MPSGSIQPEAWHDHSAHNKAVAEMEMAKSQRLRENIFHNIEQTTNDLKVQTDATNFEFRKRIYEMARAKEELEYQMNKVRGHSQTMLISKGEGLENVKNIDYRVVQLIVQGAMLTSKGEGLVKCQSLQGGPDKSSVFKTSFLRLLRLHRRVIRQWNDRKFVWILFQIP